MHEVLVEERTEKKTIFCLFWLALMDGKNSIFFLSSTNKTLGECGCVPHPSELKKIIMTCGMACSIRNKNPFGSGL